MSRRLEIELTSERPDGTWTWRAAGARQPKGELSADVLHDGAKVGDVVRAEAEFAIDGIEILSVLPPKAARKEPERLVVVGTPKDEPLVTTQLAPKGRGGRRDGRRDRGDRGDRNERRDRGARGPGGDRREPRDQGDRQRGPRPDPVPERPKPKRLRPGRTHRTAVLDQLAPEQRPIAEQVLRGGVPAVREAIAKQNEQARQENRPEVPADQLVAMAEQLLPGLRAAEWRDKAEAAIADLDQLDLRDLRSVVVAADGNTRDDEARALLQQLQDGLARRVEEDQANWVADMEANLDAGRFVRALRLSSRPPKAGAPLPPELATRLITSVSEGLTPGVNQDLWAAAVDALAFSPVRNQVVPAGRPENPSPALLDAVRRVGDRLPALVELFGLDPAEVAAAAKKRGRGPRRGGKGATGKAAQDKRDQDKPTQDKPAQDKPAQDEGGAAPQRQGEESPSDDAGKDAPAADLPTDDAVTSDPSAAPNDPGAGAHGDEGSPATGAHSTDQEPERDANAPAAEASETSGANAGEPADSEPASDELRGAAPTEASKVEVEVEGPGPDAVEVPEVAEAVVIDELTDRDEPQR